MKGSAIAGVAVAIAIAAMTALGLSAPSLFGGNTHTLSVRFPTADGLLAGSDVLEAGARIGSVDSIEPQNDNTALVVVRIDDGHWPLHNGVSAAIRPKSLLGEKYVAITDGSQSNAAYNASATLVENQQAVPVELDQFINSLDPQTRAAAQTLLDDLGAGVAGQGNNLNAALSSARTDLASLATTGKTLNNRDPDLDRILISLDSLLGTMTSDDQLTQLQQLIQNGQATLNSIETQQQSFERSFTDASAALGSVNTAFDSAVPSLRQTIDTAPSLVSQLNTESQILASLAGNVNTPSVMNQLIAGLEHGPTATGGALETSPGGKALPMFRICLATPAPTSCTGNGFSNPGAQPASSGTDSTSQMALFAAWMAS